MLQIPQYLSKENGYGKNKFRIIGKEPSSDMPMN